MRRSSGRKMADLLERANKKGGYKEKRIDVAGQENEKKDNSIPIKKGGRL